MRVARDGSHAFRRDTKGKKGKKKKKRGRKDSGWSKRGEEKRLVRNAFPLTRLGAIEKKTRNFPREKLLSTLRHVYIYTHARYIRVLGYMRVSTDRNLAPLASSQGSDRLADFS